MKKNYYLLLLLVAAIGFAQPPAGYYNNATGTGYTLKTQLYNIIKGHTDNGYAGLYVTYETSDIDNFYENDGSVLDMYSEILLQLILTLTVLPARKDVGLPDILTKEIATIENI